MPSRHPLPLMGGVPPMSPRSVWPSPRPGWALTRLTIHQPRVAGDRAGGYSLVVRTRPDPPWVTSKSAGMKFMNVLRTVGRGTGGLQVAPAPGTHRAALSFLLAWCPGGAASHPSPGPGCVLCVTQGMGVLELLLRNPSLLCQGPWSAPLAGTAPVLGRGAWLQGRTIPWHWARRGSRGPQERPEGD